MMARPTILHWRILIAINVAILTCFAIYKIAYDKPPPLPYIHLLVDYHFGYTRRALIGALLSLGMHQVPTSMIFVLGGTILLIAAALFLLVFRKTFGPAPETITLFVFLAGSPFFFKNYVRGIGYFDIYGCVLALALLLIPARSFWFVMFAAAGSATLILIHHIHMLLFIPTIAAIVVIRYCLARAASHQELAGCALILVGLLGIFLISQFYGAVDAPQEVFTQRLLSRVRPGAEKIDLSEFAPVWFRTFGEEVHDTWARLPNNLLSVPFYLVLLGLSTPLIRHYRDTVQSIALSWQRQIALVLLVLISLGYLVIFATVYDYARWISNWAVCMALMLCAIKQLPMKAAPPPIAIDNRWAFACATALTFIPEVGIRTAWH